MLGSVRRPAALSVGVVARVAGGQLERLLAGEEPLDLGPPLAVPTPVFRSSSSMHLQPGDARGGLRDHLVVEPAGVLGAWLT